MSTSGNMWKTQHENRRNISLLTSLNYTLSLAIGTVSLAYISSPLYKMFCQKMGWGGQPVKASLDDIISGDDGDSFTQVSADHQKRIDRVTPSHTAPSIKVRFRGSVSATLPWRFEPSQQSVTVRPGETALAFYTATNTTDCDIIGVATYSVAPAQIAPYFTKIQCFCFEQQMLRAGESVDMPVLFFLDKDLITDPSCRSIETITLNYTFFKAHRSDTGQIIWNPSEPL